MRILHTVHSVNPKGGGVIEGIVRVAKHQAAQGHTVEIASLDTPALPWVMECTVPMTALGEKLSSYGYSARFVPWLRANASRFDVVVVNGMWQYSSFGVWRAIGRGRGDTPRPSDPPYVVFPHGMLDPWFKRRYPLKHLKKWLYWPWAEYRVLRDARAAFFSNSTERALARESFWLYRCREAEAGFGVSRPDGDLRFQREAFLNAFPQLRGQRIILFLSRMHEKKGPDLAIRAFGELQRRMPLNLQGCRLVMAGPAAAQAYMDELRSLSDAVCQPETVCWTGMLPVAQKWGAMRAAEAFLLPSHQENYGLAVAEALACGVPVLISKEVNVWQDVVHDGAGFAERDSVEGTCSLIERWLTLPEEQKSLMRTRADKCFENRFEASKKATEMIEAFRQHGVQG